MCVRGRENFCLKEALKNVQRGRQKKNEISFIGQISGNRRRRQIFRSREAVKTKIRLKGFLLKKRKFENRTKIVFKSTS